MELVQLRDHIQALKGERDLILSQIDEKREALSFTEKEHDAHLKARWALTEAH